MALPLDLTGPASASCWFPPLHLSCSVLWTKNTQRLPSSTLPCGDVSKPSPGLSPSLLAQFPLLTFRAAVQTCLLFPQSSACVPFPRSCACASSPWQPRWGPAQGLGQQRAQLQHGHRPPWGPGLPPLPGPAKSHGSAVSQTCSFHVLPTMVPT